MIKHIHILFIGMFVWFFHVFSLHITLAPLTSAEIHELGMRIWRNECGQRVDQLTFWNKNEPFPSFGIGHFIWYPVTYQGVYTQTFPLLVRHLKKNKIKIPKWLLKAGFCPWENRNMFYEQFDSKEMIELRTLLASTVALQTHYIVKQFKKNIQSMVKSVAFAYKKRVIHNFNAVASTVNGLYSLIDYSNFKGYGTNPKESYKGNGWGLRHVLESMEIKDESACATFVKEAQRLLEKRVAHAPKDKPERQFLKGWNNRLFSYLAV